ncbi:MAG: rRNA pseudouridine synthase [Myxococcales bacterium]|nr:rRNA pseudouridine synthase [Myxococcales bacterium]MBK7194255.1 rRNA pseudouridine synthase [Myxococcales bacterium]
MAAPTLVRLQRFIAQAGIAARRKAEELITSGRVTVDGKVVTELGTKVDPLNANVQVDGEPVAPQELFYIVFNKPKACITAVTDDRGRETVMDYLPNLPVSVAPVGRLDFYSEGVLLLTNDGELAAKLLAPGSHVPKTYHVKVNGNIKAADLEHLRTGVTLDDGTVTAPAEVEELPSDSKHPWLAFTLYEGKSRQIHRMLEALGCTVTKLQRVAFANLSFHGLRVGDARELSQGELNELREMVGLDRRAGARGSWSAAREDTDQARKLRAQAQAEREAAGGMPGPVGGDDDEDEEVFERQLAARTRGGRAAPPSRDERPTRGRDERPVRGAGGGFGGRPTGGRDERPVRGAGGGGFGGRPTGGRDERPARGAGGGFGGRPTGGRPTSGRPSVGRDERPARGAGGGGFGGRPTGGRPSVGRDERPARGAGGGGFGGRPSGGRPSSERPARGAGGGGFGGRPSSERPARGAGGGGFGGRPSSDRPARGAGGGGGGFGGRPTSGGRPSSGARPTGGRPSGGGFGGRPASGGRPTGGARPSGGRPTGGARPASGRPASGGRPATGRPSGGARPASGRPGGGGRPAPRGKGGGRR